MSRRSFVARRPLVALGLAARLRLPGRRAGRQGPHRSEHRGRKGPAGAAAHDARDRERAAREAAVRQRSSTLNTFLTVADADAAQLTEFYRKAFVHVNLNTGTREEILLIPGAGKRMAREFAEYRPWKTWAQFDKEIGKYVGQPETDRLKQYVFIPVNLNTATDEDILSIPGAGPRMVREFKEYRPWKTKEQFDKEIGKYVGAKEMARLWRYVVIQ